MSRAVRRTALGLTVSSAGARTGSPAAVASAKSAFQRAMVASQHVAVPVHDPGKRQTPRMRQDTRAAGVRSLRTAFAGAALTHETDTLDNALNQEADPAFLVFGGGSDHFVYHRAEATSSTRVLIVATVRMWSRIAQVRPTDGKTIVATPASPVDVRAVVEKGSDGAWKVTSYTWSFPPGSGP
jgi:hypothetical protein